MKKTLLFLLFILGLIYWFSIQVTITNQEKKPLGATYYFKVTSHIAQTMQLNIYVLPHAIVSVECNKEKMNYIDVNSTYTYKYEEKTPLILKSGENNCSILFKGKIPHNPKVKRKITLTEYSILFLLLGVPLVSLIFELFIMSINKLFRREDERN